MNALGGRHTHTCIQVSQTKATSRNQLHASQRPACTWLDKGIGSEYTVEYKN